jgi:hypothetical protein
MFRGDPSPLVGVDAKMSRKEAPKKSQTAIKSGGGESTGRARLPIYREPGGARSLADTAARQPAWLRHKTPPVLLLFPRAAFDFGAPVCRRRAVAARSRRARSEWAVSPSWAVEPCSCAGRAVCGVAHSAGPFSQEWAVTSRRAHGPPEDLPDAWGRRAFLSSFRQNATALQSVGLS